MKRKIYFLGIFLCCVFFLGPRPASVQFIEPSCEDICAKVAAVCIAECDPEDDDYSACFKDCFRDWFDCDGDC